MFFYDIMNIEFFVENWRIKEEMKMKSTGIIRKVDELGRVVIPIELRNQFQIKEKDPIEIFVDGSSIVLKKYEKSCLFCGNTKKLANYKDKLICNKCLKQLKSLDEEE